MRIKVLTLFPEIFPPILGNSILGRAVQAGHLQVEVINIRAFSENKHKCADDYPFGGGAGMVMLAQPICDAMEYAAPSPFSGRRIYLSPRGRTFTQQVAREMAGEGDIVLLCGHYEGVDERALELCVDEELSIGDYVLTGGELAAMVVIDAVARLIPGVISDDSPVEESFSGQGLLEYPQYTRPREFRGKTVPEVLLNGNHAKIARWRREASLKLTLRRRPELLRGAELDKHDRRFLQELAGEDPENGL